MDEQDLAILSPADRQRLAKDGEFLVWPECWETLLVFLASTTQWRWALTTVQGGFISRRTGLDYTAVEAVMRMRRVPGRDRPKMLDMISRMEEAALKVINE